MKILIITTPLREAPSSTPPWGALSIMNYFRKHAEPGASIEFFNIDGLRPTYDEVLDRIKEYSPDILAISAVVSTAYAYTKKITQDTKRILPNVKVVVGGNLCASAEVLLRKADVDICVLGEGEIVFVNVVNHLMGSGSWDDLSNIPGLGYLNREDKMVNTGYEKALPADEVWDVDWTDAEHDGTIDLFFPPVPLREKMGRSIPKDDTRFDALEGSDKRVGPLACAKGCVARCTFCHRWDKGIRHIPVDTIIKRLEYMIEHYNIGMVAMIAESFGSDRKWLNELLDRIEPYNILWVAGGIRTSTVDPEIIARMKKSGCYALIYGNETGSAKMMEVMEKKVSMEDNYNAAKWTAEAGLGNIVQLVIGMPGESPETIRETIDYCIYAACLSPDDDPRTISINYAQALPGTPLYEFARVRGLLKPDIDSEEAYLISVSDKDAADPLTCINFTNYSRLTLLTWNLLIRIEVRHHHQKKFGKLNYGKILLEDTTVSRLPDDVNAVLRLKGKPTFGLFIKLLLRGRNNILMSCYPQFFYHTRIFAKVFTLLNISKEYGAVAAWALLKDHILHLTRISYKPWNYKYRSLRKIVREDIEPIKIDTKEMMPLRKGR